MLKWNVFIFFVFILIFRLIFLKRRRTRGVFCCIYFFSETLKDIFDPFDKFNELRLKS